MTAIDTVLVAFRSKDFIAVAVQAAQSLGGQVVVVDHGDGASAKTVASLGAKVLVDPSNPGFGAGQNRGVANTSTSFVLLCNPDAKIVPDAVATGAALLEDRPEVAAVQGVIVNLRTGHPERSAGVELGSLHLLGRAVGARVLLRFSIMRAMGRRIHVLRDHVQRVPQGAVEVEGLAATAVLVRRSAYESVGGFDESYFLYGEDLDLCRRLRQAGWKLVAVPETWATHASGGSAETSWKREVAWWRGTMQFASIWWSETAWRSAIAAATIRSLTLVARNPAQIQTVLSGLLIEPMQRRHTTHEKGQAVKSDARTG